MPAADLVLVGGSVLTMESASGLTKPAACAVAVAGGRIVAVGDDRSIDEHAGPRTRRIDLEGRTLLPSFTDAHVHPVLAGVELLRCGLHELPESKEAYLAFIRSYAEANPDLDWIIGSGWAMAAFTGGTPSRADLDAALPDRPAFLQNRDGHGAWVNSRALEMAGVTRSTADPADGRIERTADGEPQGTLHEGAMALVERLLPEPSIDELVDGLGLAHAYLHRLGITAWQDAWVDEGGLEEYRNSPMGRSHDAADHPTEAASRSLQVGARMRSCLRADLRVPARKPCSSRRPSASRSRRGCGRGPSRSSRARSTSSESRGHCVARSPEAT